MLQARCKGNPPLIEPHTQNFGDAFLVCMRKLWTYEWFAGDSKRHDYDARATCDVIVMKRHCNVKFAIDKYEKLIYDNKNDNDIDNNNLKWLSYISFPSISQ